MTNDYVLYPGCNSADAYISEPTIPTITDVLDFAHSIGIPEISIKPGYEKWWNILHEIGHFAVKPDSYLQLWREHGSPDAIPNLNWLSGNGIIKPQDPTPDEWGVRAWCLSVLQHQGWLNPLRCPDYPMTQDWEGRSFNNPYQWQKNQITSKSHPLYKDGFRQLEIMGIDISQEIFRPTVEICIQGWQPIVSWQFSQSA
ncbi:MAG: hypothetical protein WBA57_26410 [Elainellaceae cyanobacterium]